jgi:hypothetical protein
MPSTSTRRAAGLLAGGIALAALTGCNIGFSSDSVDCSSSSCTVELSGEGTEAKILGTTVTLGSVQDGRATISVGGANVSCSQGESVTAGPLEMTCTTVTEDSVKLTATVN